MHYTLEGMCDCGKFEPPQRIMKKALLLLACIASMATMAQDKPAYVMYNSKGKKVSYKKMIKVLKGADVLLFGEYHNNPISHWLQLEVTKDLDQSRDLVLGAEMIEADNQDELDQYLKGEIDAKAFDTLARLWPNYYTDYAPLVDYAKDNKLQFVAANVPRRYASMVYHGGFDTLNTLSDEEKSWIAPLPIPYDKNLPGYVKMIEMMGGHGGDNLPKAQAIKDATMAHFILKYFKAGQLFIHYNGTYHSDDYEGIQWYLKKQNPELNCKTISTVSQANVKQLAKENKGKADFILCVDENMTGTH